MKRAVLLTFVVMALSIAAAGPSAAQREASPEHREQMKKLEFLAGTWKGSGWMDFGGRRSQFASSEVIETKLDGLIAMVEGVHTADIPGRDAPTVVHHAFGIMCWDPKEKKHKFQTHVASGHGGVFDMEVGDQKVIWGYENEYQGTVRYTITIDEQGRWFETGEASKDGETWNQFFEMTLSRDE